MNGFTHPTTWANFGANEFCLVGLNESNDPYWQQKWQKAINSPRVRINTYAGGGEMKSNEHYSAQSPTDQESWSGPMPEKPHERKHADINTMQKLNNSALAYDWYILTAAAPETSAGESASGGGLFTRAFLKAIQKHDIPLGNLRIEIQEELMRMQNREKLQIPGPICNTLSRELSDGWMFCA